VCRPQSKYHVSSTITRVGLWKDFLDSENADPNPKKVASSSADWKETSKKLVEMFKDVDDFELEEEDWSIEMAETPSAPAPSIIEDVTPAAKRILFHEDQVNIPPPAPKSKAKGRGLIYNSFYNDRDSYVKCTRWWRHHRSTDYNEKVGSCAQQ
jgi:hypothetical protein